MGPVLLYSVALFRLFFRLRSFSISVVFLSIMAIVTVSVSITVPITITVSIAITCDTHFCTVKYVADKVNSCCRNILNTAENTVDSCRILTDYHHSSIYHTGNKGRIGQHTAWRCIHDHVIVFTRQNLQEFLHQTASQNHGRIFQRISSGQNIQSVFSISETDIS